MKLIHIVNIPITLAPSLTPYLSTDKSANQIRAFWKFSFKSLQVEQEQKPMVACKVGNQPTMLRVGKFHFSSPL